MIYQTEGVNVQTLVILFLLLFASVRNRPSVVSTAANNKLEPECRTLLINSFKGNLKLVFQCCRC